MESSATTDLSVTMIRRKEQFEDRWSSYGSHAGLTRLSEMLSPSDLKEIDLFKDYDDAFLRNISPDISVADWDANVVLFEEGSYLDVAFYLLEGTVEIDIKKHDETVNALPIFDAQRTVFAADLRSFEEPEEGFGATVIQTRMAGRETSKDLQITFLASMDFNLQRGRTTALKKGDLFGEIGALNGWPQSATASTSSACKLVQIRVPALREMKKASGSFKEKVDRIYRERTLFEQLKTSPLFRGSKDTFLESLAEMVELISFSPDDIVTEQGQTADAFYMVRSGFLKISERLGEADATVNYLSKGMTIGEVELLLPDVETWLSTVSSVGYSELVRIERTAFQRVLREHPNIEKRLWESAVALVKDSGYTKKHLEKSELIEFSLQKGLVQGNSILVIDLDVCTRCDDCVRGCADTHGGRPRFVREGDKFGQFMIARSCYHCDDPVCLIGCPTGAISRIGVGEVVAIDDELCIGCSNCAMKCPYDAIVMHDTGETWDDDAVPERLRGRPKKVASKCDVCYTSADGPACVNSCPHSCAFRIGSIEDFQTLISTERGEA